MNDAGSLQNLNDIVVPAPAAWWPLAPGWYVLAGVLLLLGAWWAFRQWSRWKQNRYRRQALSELALIRDGGNESNLREVPVLLKRTAVSAWPRDEVASLSGEAWHRFLDRTAGFSRFCGGAGKTLDQLSYAGRDELNPPAAEIGRLMDAAESWLKHHCLQSQGG